MRNDNPDTRPKSSPQVDTSIPQGFTAIPNELLEHLAQLYLRPNDWQVFLAITRKTLGWRKEVDYIANSQIMEATGLGKTVVSQSLGELHKRNVITRKKKQIGVQQDWKQWRLAERQIRKKLAKQQTPDTKLANQQTSQKLANQTTELARQQTKVSYPRDTQKKTETIQKKETEIPLGFTALKQEISKSKNKVGFLVAVFKNLHSHAPPEDFEDLGGRLAGILKLTSNDYGYLLKLIWETAAADVAGSHLNYIHGIIRKTHRHTAELADSGHYKKLDEENE